MDNFQSNASENGYKEPKDDVMTIYSLSTHVNSSISVIDEKVKSAILFSLDSFKECGNVFVFGVIALHGDTFSSS